MEVVGKVIEVNNQIVIQTTIITMRNLGIRQIIVIKTNMMHKMESCNKGIMH
jgi:dTDP-glucose pyrophosphorylase